ncbi:SDR family oxidoreductase [Shewanella colwelliana]|uniref:SDR family oxidoreductase n=1 Tax=Shewanella colwelliana TaxID=23 RepID=UPI0037355D8E
MINSIAIVGCGWFGLPLAKTLLANGMTVNGSKRSAEQAETLKQQGIKGFVLDLDNPQACDNPQTLDGLKTDAIVINIPPGLRRGEGLYLERLNLLKALISDHHYQKIVFISTTGVYPATGEVMREDDAFGHSPQAAILCQAEAVFAELPNCVIVRFAGLVGPKRHPGRFLAGKTRLSGAELSVNMTHLDDCIGSVSAILAHPKPPSNAYSVCAPQHPSKQTFYQAAASQLGLTLPTFLAPSSDEYDKVVDGSRITRDLNFHYKHPDPLLMLGACE